MRRGAAIAVMLAASCYRTDPRSCAVTCATSGICPTDMTCAADGFCHAAGDDESCGTVDAIPRADVATASDATCETRVIQVSLGYAFTCARTMDRALWCWGQNHFAQLGEAGPDDPLPRRVPTWPPVTDDLAANFHHSTCVVSGGRVSCVGENNQAQLGDGTMVDRTMPVEAVGVSAAVQVAVGGPLGCARVGDKLYCWGANEAGQNGTGDLDPHPSPTLVPSLAGVTDFATGYHHACAILGGDLSCWGYMWGNGQAGNTSTPAAVAGMTGVTEVAAGLDFTCALKGAGEVWCWGACFDGECGQAGGGAPIVPARVNLPGAATSVSTGSYHACASLADGTVWCWGQNEHGQLGDGTEGPDSAAPVQVRGLTGAATVDAGEFATCAVRTAGNLVCWGENDHGQLGDGTTTRHPTPTEASFGCR